MSLLSIFLTILAIVFIIMLIRYLFYDPYTLTGVIDASIQTNIPASSLATNGTVVPQTNFAYSIWFFVNDWNVQFGRPKVLFANMMPKNSSISDPTSIPVIGGSNPCPTVVLGAYTNDLTIYVTSFPSNNSGTNKVMLNTFNVSNIPIQKWVNLIISVYGTTLDAYLDGKLVSTFILQGIAKINPGNSLFVTPLGGFNGFTSRFQYFPNPINPQEAWNIYRDGYGSNFLSNLLGSYQLQVALINNGVVQNKITV
jgi:hypothetical protein